jgi:tetratricopeptide (TPR) repeat protein
MVMKKVLSLIVCISIFEAAVCFGRDKPLANANKAGLYVRSIEQVLRLEADEIDLATAVLIASEQWSNIVHGRRYLAELDDMALEIRHRLDAKGLGADYKAIAVINEYLFKEKGFKSVSKASDPNDLFLHSVLDKKRGYCLSLSVVYLSLAERLGLPLYGVVVPGHFFVRYDDGRVRFNIETTSRGGNAPDEHYIKEFKVPEGDNNSFYMQNLNKLQTLGCFFNNLGNSYSDIGDMESAMLALERAVEINPSLAESHMNLGNIYLQKERTEDAIYEYRAALEINPSDAKTHNNLGNAYTKQGRLNDAISHYLRSIKLAPGFVDAYKNLANAYCRQEKFGQAIVRLKEAIALEPENAGLYSQSGDVYRQMADYEAAMVQYKKALKIKGDSAEAYYGLAVCHNKLGQVDKEIAAYKKALVAKPDMVAALVNLGNAYFGKQKYDAAVEMYRRAILIKPEDAAIHYNLAAAYSNNGDFEQAVAEYKKAIEIEPEMGDAHSGLVFAYYKLGKYNLAAEHIKIAKGLGIDIDKELVAAIEDKVR